ncbi:MAG: hypothetical protein II086_05950, partial [Ruminococcus sp.]|nr:hypothetical protein [Ruminococcus sp.]
IDRGDQPKNVRIPFHVFDFGAVKASHCLTSDIFPYILTEFKGIVKDIRDISLIILCDIRGNIQ